MTTRPRKPRTLAAMEKDVLAAFESELIPHHSWNRDRQASLLARAERSIAAHAAYLKRRRK